MSLFVVSEKNAPKPKPVLMYFSQGTIVTRNSDGTQTTAYTAPVFSGDGFVITSALLQALTDEVFKGKPCWTQIPAPKEKPDSPPAKPSNPAPSRKKQEAPSKQTKTSVQPKKKEGGPKPQSTGSGSRRARR